MKMVALIPAYNPPAQLTGYVRRLVASEWEGVVVVNDGSAVECAAVFEALSRLPKVTVCRHAVNRGKGAALLTGLNYVYCNYPGLVGVVTVDADGQHLLEDALGVARALANHPASLVLGVRAFDRRVPWRNRLGNRITRCLFRWLIGQKITDTQTGLRGIPRDFIPNLLKLETTGYEFELDMLLACKHCGREIREQPIQTVYLEGNRGSHFNPLVDSMRVYFALFRFTLTSLATALLDYSVFLLAYGSTGNLAASQALARLAAMGLNYAAVRRWVFYSEQPHVRTLPKYLALVAVSGSMSYVIIQYLSSRYRLPVTAAKMIAETLIFLANFAIQRDFIFSRARRPARTDWDRYYRQPYRTARFSRRITEKKLHHLIRAYALADGQGLRLGELGGAGSCFCANICAGFPVAQYHVVDNNALGLAALRERIGNRTEVILHHQDILDGYEDLGLDLVFSVGLIEHFSVADTRKAIAAHFRWLKPGGLAIILFPTPTWLYRVTRGLAEATGQWIFHDERPLARDEVAAASLEHGEIIHEEINWPIFLTQMILVVRKRTAERRSPEPVG